MTNPTDIILYDRLMKRKVNGEFTGSIISKCKDKIIFSNNIRISDDEGISIIQGLLVGFEKDVNKVIAVSKKSDFLWKNLEEDILEYSVLIPEDTMEQYDKGQFSDDFPYTLNLLHTAGLLLNAPDNRINHLDFFKGEILKNPVCSVLKGILVADRVVIDDKGDPYFYDCLIIGRDEHEDLKVSYDTIVNLDEKNVDYIIILGIEELKI